MTIKPEAQFAELEAETQDEIEQIMNEIEELQQGLSQSSPAQKPVEAPQASVAAAPPASTKTPSQRSAPALSVVTSTPPVVPDVSSLGESTTEEEQQILKEFAEGFEDSSDPSPFDSSHSDLPEEDGEKKWVEETMANVQEVSSRRESQSASSGSHSDAPRHDMFATRRSDTRAPEAQLGSGGSLAMTVGGTMTLRLRYEDAQEEIQIHFDSDAIRIEMAGGTEFKVPMKKRANIRAA